MIINTINGDSNVSFFKQYKDAGLTPDQIQTMSFSCYEEDIRGMGAEYAEGHLFAWNYFQSVDTDASKAFTKNSKSCTETTKSPETRLSMPTKVCICGKRQWKKQVHLMWNL